MRDPSKQNRPRSLNLDEQNISSCGFFPAGMYIHQIVFANSHGLSQVLLNALSDTVVCSLTQHLTLFPFGHPFRCLTGPAIFTPPLSPSRTHSSYTSPCSPLTHLLLDRTLVPSSCSICTSFLPVVHSPFVFSCVKFVLYHHGFYSYVTYSY